MSNSPKIFNIEQVATCSYHIAGSVDFMASDGNCIWITNPDMNTLQCFDAKQSTPLYETIVPKAVGIPVYAFDAVWVASLEQQSIYKIEPNTGEILAIIATGLGDLSGEFSLAASPEGVWVVSADTQLSMIDPISCTVTDTVEVESQSYNLRYGDDSLWLSNQNLNTVQRIDPKSKTVIAQIEVGERPVFLAFGEHAVWTLNQTHGTVSKIDTMLNQVVATIQLPDLAKGDGGDIDVSHGKVWVRTTHILLIQIDCHSLEIEKIYQHAIAAGSGAICAQDQLLWVSAHDIDKLWAIPLNSN